MNLGKPSRGNFIQLLLFLDSKDFCFVLFCLVFFNSFILDLTSVCPKFAVTANALHTLAKRWCDVLLGFKLPLRGLCFSLISGPLLLADFLVSHSNPLRLFPCEQTLCVD